MRILYFPWLLLLWLVLRLPIPSLGAEPPPEVAADVVVYGGTPAGIAAAIAAGKSGRTVALVEPYRWVGGLTTNGLSHPDFRTFEGLTGTYLELTRRAHAHYVEKYGADSPQAQESLRGTHAEPHVNRLVFEKMLAEQPNVHVWLETTLSQVEVKAAQGKSRIESATFETSQGKTFRGVASLWIDATYEGDLMAQARVPFRVGREARSEYDESLAPDMADSQVQGYNFRLIMTQREEHRVTPAAPPGYRREDFLELLPLLKEGRFESVFCFPTGGLYKAHLPPLPNGKHDINDVSRGLVRLSLPDINDAWPDGDAATRRRIYDEHVRHNLGMLYFLQNDREVPPPYRDEAQRWGWCKDEFAETAHVPEQLYIREARRMVGHYVFTERDTDHAPGDARAVFHADAIAMGDYGPNCHGTSHEGPRFGGRHSGEFYKGVSPYQIPYGVIVPKDCENLLVPVACSASHVGFCALRLEPIWTSLGQAAGHAAHLALAEKSPLQKVSPEAIRQRLHSEGAATIYVSDVPSDSPDFAAVQWWGALGGLHGLAPQPERAGQRGANIVGQYYEAFPNHAAELDKPLDDALKARWLALAKTHGIRPAALESAATRGDLIRKAFELR